MKHIKTGAIEITSQNHVFAITHETLPDDCVVTHINMNDETIAGFSSESQMFYSVQYHPEASPGPHDALYLFDPFIEMMAKRRT